MEKPVTSYDFAESWRQILRPDFPTDISHQLYFIQNAKEVKQGHKSPKNWALKLQILLRSLSA